MQVLSREVFRTHSDGRPVVNGFVSYVHRDDPVLMLCTGYEDYSDAYDDYACCVSTDNGRTWSAPELKFKSHDVPGGRVRYAEPGALFDPDTGKLIVLIDRSFHPNDKLDVDGRCEIQLDVYDPATRQWSGPAPLGLDPGRSLAVSFCFPIKTSDGRLLFPAMRHVLGEDGRPTHYKGCWAPAHESVTIIGTYGPDGRIAWELGRPAAVDLEKTSRGLDENTIAELADGRLAMICRGDNSMFPERPGYKWLCLSDDGARTWSDPVPLPCDKGDPIESGANGSALFRSIKTGKLYWIGNLCIDGVRPRGNYPRTPIVIAEVQEEPFALKRDTVFAIDRRVPHEPPEVQMSNFRFYQDRHTGDLILFLTRYAEHDAKDWMRADFYRYRVCIE